MPCTSVLIALPAFGQVNTSFTTASLVALTSHLAARGQFGGFTQLSFPDLEDLRSMFLTIWLDKTDASHILFVDADMYFEPELVLEMIDFDKPLVGCIYPKRKLPIDWVGSPLLGPQVVESGFLKMEGIGFGATLISRDCVQAMINTGNVEVATDLDAHVAGKMLKDRGISRMIRAFDKIKVPGRRLSEDYSFCLRHRNSGGDVWGAINHRVVHVGDYGFGGRYGDGMFAGKLPDVA